MSKARGTDKMNESARNPNSIESTEGIITLALESASLKDFEIDTTPFFRITSLTMKGYIELMKTSNTFSTMSTKSSTKEFASTSCDGSVNALTATSAVSRIIML